jgi:hypothetical protein
LTWDFIHNPADICQTSSPLGVLVGAIATIGPFLTKNLFHDERSTVFLKIFHDVRICETKTITNQLIHLPPSSNPEQKYFIARCVLRNKATLNRLFTDDYRFHLTRESRSMRLTRDLYIAFSLDSQDGFPYIPTKKARLATI